MLTQTHHDMIKNLDSLIYSLDRGHIGFSFLHFFEITLQDLKLIKNADNFLSLPKDYQDNLHQREKALLVSFQKQREVKDVHILINMIAEQYDYIIDLEKSVLDYEIKTNSDNPNSERNSNKI